MALSACPLTSGITRDCRDVSPGLVTLRVTEQTNLTIARTAASGILTNAASYLTSGKKYWSYEFEFGKADETEVVTTNTNGTISVKQTLNLYIPKKQASVAQQILLLCKQDVSFVVGDKNSKFRLLGDEFGMRVTSVNAASGKMGNDDSGYTIVLEGEERTLAPEVPTALAALLLLPA